MKVQIGISESQRQKTSAILQTVLADTYALLIKTQAYHWNVEGPWFHDLHGLFETQYRALFEAADEIAERIRALGIRVQADLAFFQKSACLPQPSKSPTTATAMIGDLLASHEHIIQEVRSVLPEVTQNGDEGTFDFLVGRLQDHEKTAWMLRSLLVKREK